MNILVTGGSGFIGSHLVKTLVEKEYEVRCLVRRASDVKHLEKLGVELVYGDILDANSLVEAVKHIDIIYHLVGAGNVSATSEEAFKEYYNINALGTQNLLDASKSANIRKFVYLSSMAAMGIIKDLPIDETSPCNPFAPYERSKYESEKIVERYWLANKTPTTIIRPPMVYGIGDAKSEVLKMCKMIKKHTFPIIGSGECSMPMVYIDNLIQGIILAGESDNSIGKTYIITDERTYSLNEVVQTIAKELDVKLWSLHVPIWCAKVGIGLIEFTSKMFKFTPPFTLHRVESVTSNRVYNISKSREELGYEPKISLEEGINRLVEWYKKETLL